MFLTFLRRATNSFSIFLVAALAPVVSVAEDSSGRDVYIQQIVTQQQSATGTRTARAPVTGAVSPELSGFERQLVSLGDSLPLGITQAQQGQGHTASATVIGNKNTVGQFQLGKDHVSNVELTGANNRVVVMQRRQKAFSDIEVSGANKTIYHLQLGPTARLKEIPFRTTKPETLMIIDNGRSAYVRKMK
ncbi:hypothetical protein N4R57_12200 [Rhodobacteraceae bacterium D3-12]|nr:hypothetical protein N4R57_12200 [Rhodobacteraceae bacterium D3-12]